MYHAKRKKFDWTFVLGVNDTAMSILAAVLSYLWLGLLPDAGHAFAPGPSPVPGNLTIYGLLLLLFFKRSSLYTWRRFVSRSASVLRIFGVLIQAAALFLVLAVIVRMDMADILPWLAAQTIGGFFLVWGGRMIASRAMMDWFSVIPQEVILVIGWSHSMDKVVEAYRKEVGRFQTLLGFLEVPGQPLDPNLVARGVRSLGRMEDFEEIAQETGATLLLIDETAVTAHQMYDLTTACSNCGTHLLLLPTAVHGMTRRMVVRRIGGISLIGVQGVPLDLFYNRFVKRTVDIVGSLVGSAISIPIIFILGVLIKRESPGPIFFKQKRMGRDGRPFEIWKLRSMRLDSNSESLKFTTVNDPRVLKVGRFIRRWNLDEIPQFFNVLRGDMSLVGPRPEVLVTIDQLKRDIRHYNLRHHCRPGLTGWAAINGYRGGHELLPERLEYDLEYYEQWTLAFDFYIMLRTLLPPKNAF